MKLENLEDWCKWLEKNFSPEVMIPTLPVIIRFDGVNFSNWTSDLKKPFDERLLNLMVDTTMAMVKETGAVLGYTQSDEITLILYSDSKNSQIYHDGKKQKILSKLTSALVQHFNDSKKLFGLEGKRPAIFDCRIYQVPTLSDAVAQIIWRENDAVRNSKLNLARSVFSHREIQGVHTGRLESMMEENGVVWSNLRSGFKWGSYIKMIRSDTPFTSDEISKLPPNHDARKNPSLMVSRKRPEATNIGPLGSVSNRVGVVFYDEKPVYVTTVLKEEMEVR